MYYFELWGFALYKDTEKGLITFFGTERLLSLKKWDFSQKFRVYMSLANTRAKCLLRVWLLLMLADIVSNSGNVKR